MKQDDCIFCKISNGNIESSTIYEDEDFRVILDLNPASSGHALILTKEHFQDACDLELQIARKIFPLAGKIGRALKAGLGCSGFNIVQNNGTAAGQTVFHFHVHVIPRYEQGPDMIGWEPGIAEQKKLQELAEKIKAAL